MKYSASPQVHEMAKKLFIKKMAKITKVGIMTSEVSQIKQDCYFIARVFYNEAAED